MPPDIYALLVVGGGPAGLAAARSYRRAGGPGRVGIVTDERRLPYRRPPLSKELLRGESDASGLAIEDEAFLDEQRIDLISGHVASLDATSRRAKMSGGGPLRYGQCVLCTGAEPQLPDIPGGHHPRVLTLRGLDDLRRLEDRLHSRAEVAVVGSGFIGCEVAASLTMRGHPTALVSSEAAPGERRLGPQVADAMATWLSALGVDRHQNAGADGIEHQPGGQSTVLTGRGAVNADLVVMATGVRPRGELAQQAGIALAQGAIPVDAAMRTGVNGLLAAGDVAVAVNVTAGRRVRVEHWGDALAQGEVAGRSAAGVDVAWDGVPGFWSTIGTHTLKYVGWGDGFDVSSFERHDGYGFTARYGRAGRLVGVLTYLADADYEDAREQIAGAAPWPPVA